MIFEKNDYVEIDGVNMFCLIADESHAVLIPYKRMRDGSIKQYFSRSEIFSNEEEFRYCIKDLKFIRS